MRPLLPNPDWLRLYQSEALPRLTAEAVFGRLSGARVAGGKLRAPCPLHGGKSPSFAVDLKTLRWFCHSKCAAGGGPIEFIYLQQGGSGQVRGPAFIEVVKELCSRVGVRPCASLPETLVRGVDVETVWKSARPVTTDADVARWLADHRGLDPELIATLDLARVLHPKASLPQWAGFENDGRWKSWPAAGYRVVVPLFDSIGRMGSLRFRAPRPGAKGRSATGVSGKGLVMADPIARGVLESGSVPPFREAERFAVVVAEGEPDFWSWATEPAYRGLAEGAATFPAVLGVVSGSFDQTIAARLPTGTSILSAIHRDEGGDRIHARLVGVLAEANRDFGLSRWCPT